MTRPALLRSVLLFFVALGAPLLVRGQTLYWDTNGSGIGAQSGSGNWDLSSLNWTTDADGNISTQAWSNGGDANFLGSAGGGSWVVTVGAGVSASSMFIDNTGGNSWTFDGASPITLTGSATLNVFQSVVMYTGFAGSAGLHVSTSGNVYLRAASTYTGATGIDGGNVSISDGGAFGVTGAGNHTEINGDANLTFVADLVLAEELKLNTTGTIALGSVFDSSASNVTLSGKITLGQEARFSSGEGVLTLSGNIGESSAGHGLVIEGNAILTGTNTFTGALVLDGGTATIDTLTDAGVASAAGAGDTIYLGQAHMGEGTYYNDGTLRYNGSSSASSDRSIIIAGDNGALDIVNPTATLTLTGTVSGEGDENSQNLVKAGAGTLVLRGDNSFLGNTNLLDGTLILGHDNAAGIGSESEIRVGGEGTAYNAQLSLLLENGVTLDRYVSVYNQNNDGGSTTLGLSGAGTAAFGEEVYITRSVGVKVNSGGTLNFNEFFSDGSGGGYVTKSGDGLVSFNDGIDLRGGGLVINGGEVRLSGGDNFIYFSNGITVNSGGTLSGAAFVQGAAVQVAAGGILSPGDPFGNLTVQSLLMNSGSQLTWQIAGLTTSDTSQFDQVVVLTQNSEGDYLQIDNGATLTVDLSLLSLGLRPTNANPLLNDSFWQTTQTWLLVDFQGPGYNAFGFGGQLNPFTLNNGTVGGGVFTTFVGDGTNGFTVGNVYLQFTPVPEPSTWALLLTGAAMVSSFVLRRRRA